MTETYPYDVIKSKTPLRNGMAFYIIKIPHLVMSDRIGISVRIS